MAGLLDDFSEFIKTPGGQGLLSAAFGGLAGARRGAPLNSLGNAGLAGLSGYSGALDREKQAAEAAQMQEMRKLQMQQAQIGLNAAQANADKEKAFRDAAQRNAIPAQAATPGGLPADMLSALPSEFQTGVQVAPQAARPASFNYEGYANDISAADPMEAFKVRQMLQKDDAPIKLGAGEQLFSGKASGYKPLLSVPGKESALPSAIQEYQFAQKQGYQGTFEQWDTARKRAGATKVDVPVNLGQKGLDNTLKVRSDFRSEPIYKAHGEVQSAHSQITTALKQNSPAGDLAGATKLMKILDPGSVVRESELGMAMAASGLMDRVTNYADMVLKGTKLTPTQRKDFQTLSDALLKESQTQYSAKRKEYQGIAERNQLNTEDILGPEPKPMTPKKAVVKTGMFNGRKVVQYSDGTTDYAD